MAGGSQAAIKVARQAVNAGSRRHRGLRRDVSLTPGGAFLTGPLRSAGYSRFVEGAMDLVGDLLYVGLAVGFFGLTWAFVKLCERV